MKNRRTALTVFAIMSVLASACARTADVEQEKKNVQQVFEAYIESVKTADLSLASRVWMQSPDIIAVTPLGRFQGWDSVRNDLYVNFLQKAFTERNLTPSHVAITVNGDTAWTVFDWTFAATTADGKPFSSKGWETHVYRKTDRGWAILHLHYSGQPTGS